MKRFYKPIAVIAFLASFWFAGQGFYYITNPAPDKPPAQNTFQRELKPSQQEQKPSYRPYPATQPVPSGSIPTVQPQPAEQAQPQTSKETPPREGDPVVAPDSDRAGPAPAGAAGADAGQPGRDAGYVRVVLDGDTVKVKLDNSAALFTVRLLGVDAPELVLNEFGITASDYARRLLLDKRVNLAYDLERLDKYGRTLAYVYLEDGTFINARLVEEGYARVMAIPPNTAHAAELEELQAAAQKARLGIWADPPPPCTWRERKVIKTWYFNDADIQPLSFLNGRALFYL